MRWIFFLILLGPSLSLAEEPKCPLEFVEPEPVKYDPRMMLKIEPIVFTFEFEPETFLEKALSKLEGLCKSAKENMKPLFSFAQDFGRDLTQNPLKSFQEEAKALNRHLSEGMVKSVDGYINLVAEFVATGKLCSGEELLDETKNAFNVLMKDVIANQETFKKLMRTAASADQRVAAAVTLANSLAHTVPQVLQLIKDIQDKKNRDFIEQACAFWKSEFVNRCLQQGNPRYLQNPNDLRRRTKKAVSKLEKASLFGDTGKHALRLCALTLAADPNFYDKESPCKRFHCEPLLPRSSQPPHISHQRFCQFTHQYQPSRDPMQQMHGRTWEDYYSQGFDEVHAEVEKAKEEAKKRPIRNILGLTDVAEIQARPYCSTRNFNPHASGSEQSTHNPVPTPSQPTPPELLTPPIKNDPQFDRFQRK